MAARFVRISGGSVLQGSNKRLCVSYVHEQTVCGNLQTVCGGNGPLGGLTDGEIELSELRDALHHLEVHGGCLDGLHRAHHVQNAVPCVENKLLRRGRRVSDEHE